MPWPMSQDYNEAIQNPIQCFDDPELKQGEAVCNALGLPVPWSGNFADVYAVQSGQRKWAVKCFTRQIPGLQERYVQISKYLKQVQLPFMVDFSFLERGIQVRGQWYPVLKMQWVEGFPFNTFVKDNLDKPQVLQTLCQIWLKLATKLREANLAHGDLQHGNVLLVPGSKAGSVGIKLVDYDGMCVPALELLKSIEVGHPAYQHPVRLKEGGYGLHIDRFSELVIYTALRALSIGGRSLWEKFDNGDNLLFKQPDFEVPGKSAVFQELQKSPDAEVRKLTAALAQAAGKPIPQVPLLEDLVEMPKPATKVQAAAPAVTRSAVAAGSGVEDMFAAATGHPVVASDRRRTKHSPRKKSFAGVAMLMGLAAAILIGGVVLFAAMSGSTSTNNEAVAEAQKTKANQPISQPIKVVTRPTFRERPETKPQTRPDPKTEPKTEPKTIEKRGWASFRSHSFPDLFIAHGDYLGGLFPEHDLRKDGRNGTFEIVAGLASDKMVSLRSFNFPDHYLAHKGMRLHLQQIDNSDGYKANATFKLVPGLASDRGVSFEASNSPGYYICPKDKQLHVIKDNGTEQFKKDATFSITEPLPGLVPAPFAQWLFEKDASDSMGRLNGTLIGGAVVANGRLQLKAEGAYLKSAPLPQDIREKTLEAWVVLPDAKNARGSLLQILDEKKGTWDGIMYAEVHPQQWYPGSSSGHRSKKLDAPPENADPGQMVHVAAVYAADNSITFYRNGKGYSAPFVPSGNASTLQTYPKAKGWVKIGDFRTTLICEVIEARLYNRALTEPEVAASFHIGPTSKKDPDPKQEPDTR